MKNLNKQFFSLTKSFGSDIELVQGAGGNSSIKSSDRDYFLVKGSGTWMKDALKKDIFLNVDGKNIYDDFLNELQLFTTASIFDFDCDLSKLELGN